MLRKLLVRSGSGRRLQRHRGLVLGGPAADVDDDPAVRLARRSSAPPPSTTSPPSTSVKKRRERSTSSETMKWVSTIPSLGCGELGHGHDCRRSRTAEAGLAAPFRRVAAPDRRHAKAPGSGPSWTSIATTHLTALGRGDRVRPAGPGRRAHARSARRRPGGEQRRAGVLDLEGVAVPGVGDHADVAGVVAGTCAIEQGANPSSLQRCRDESTRAVEDPPSARLPRRGRRSLSSSAFATFPSTRTRCPGAGSRRGEHLGYPGGGGDRCPRSRRVDPVKAARRRRPAVEQRPLKPPDRSAPRRRRP